MGRYYILREGVVVEEPDYEKWAAWYQRSYQDVRCIANTKVQYGTVSTSFLAMSLTLSKSDPPMLFETRIQGGWMHDQWERFPTLEAAKAGHEAWVARVRSAEQGRPPPPGFVW